MNGSVTVLIVDDEPLARRRLRKLIEADDELRLVGECANADEAAKAIRLLRPRLLFLDIQMPRKSGFELLAEIDAEQMPLVVFVTAFDKYAVRAFDIHAIDYLLKPYTAERFGAAVQVAKKRLREELNEHLAERTLALLAELRTGYAERLLVKANEAIVFLNATDIDWIETQDKYVRIHAGPETYLLRESISHLSARLDPRGFLRIHRSYLVNIDRIKRLEPWFNQEYQVVLRDGTRLTLSRGQRKRLGDVLGAGI
ncbi:MAG: LytTR family DNA-binding domain-containing protein [Pyrinomonadaceae bacterium]